MMDIKDYRDKCVMPDVDIENLTTLDGLPEINNDVLLYTIDKTKHTYNNSNVFKLVVYTGKRYIEKVYYLEHNGKYRNNHIDQAQRIKNQKTIYTLLNAILLLTDDAVQYQLYTYSQKNTTIILNDSFVKCLSKIITAPSNLMLYLKNMIYYINAATIHYGTRRLGTTVKADTGYVWAEYSGLNKNEMRMVSIPALVKCNSYPNSRTFYSGILYKDVIVPICGILFYHNRNVLYNNFSTPLGKWDLAKVKRCAPDIIDWITITCQIYKNIGRYTAVLPEIEL